MSTLDALHQAIVNNDVSQFSLFLNNSTKSEESTCISLLFECITFRRLQLFLLTLDLLFNPLISNKNLLAEDSQLKLRSMTNPLNIVLPSGDSVKEYIILKTESSAMFKPFAQLSKLLSSMSFPVKTPLMSNPKFQHLVTLEDEQIELASTPIDVKIQESTIESIFDVPKHSSPNSSDSLNDSFRLNSHLNFDDDSNETQKSSGDSPFIDPFSGLSNMETGVFGSKNKSKSNSNSKKSTPDLLLDDFLAHSTFKNAINTNNSGTPRSLYEAILSGNSKHAYTVLVKLKHLAEKTGPRAHRARTRIIKQLSEQDPIFGRTLFHACVISHSPNLFHFLCSLCFDSISIPKNFLWNLLCVPDFEGNNIFHLACHYRNPFILQLVVSEWKTVSLEIFKVAERKGLNHSTIGALTNHIQSITARNNLNVTGFTLFEFPHWNVFPDPDYDFALKLKELMSQIKSLLAESWSHITSAWPWDPLIIPVSLVTSKLNIFLSVNHIRHLYIPQHNKSNNHRAFHNTSTSSQDSFMVSSDDDDSSSNPTTPRTNTNQSVQNLNSDSAVKVPAPRKGGSRILMKTSSFHKQQQLKSQKSLKTTSSLYSKPFKKRVLSLQGQLLLCAAYNRANEFRTTLSLAESHLLRVSDSNRLWTPLHWAAYSGAISIVEEIFQFCGLVHDANLLSLQDHQGRTPLHIAAFYGQHQCLKLFLRWYIFSGIKALSSSFEKISPLSSLTDHSGSTIMDLALNPHWSVSEPEALASAQIMSHCYDIHVDLLPVLTTKVPTSSQVNSFPMIPWSPHLPIHSLTHLSNCAKLIEVLPSVNPTICRNRCGKTPLHIACAQGNLEVVDLLMQLGNFHRVVNVRDHFGFTALMYAAQYHKVNVIEYLVTFDYPSEKINPTLTCSNGISAVEYALNPHWSVPEFEQSQISCVDWLCWSISSFISWQKSPAGRRAKAMTISVTSDNRDYLTDTAFDSMETNLENSLLTPQQLVSNLYEYSASIPEPEKSQENHQNQESSEETIPHESGQDPEVPQDQNPSSVSQPDTTPANPNSLSNEPDVIGPSSSSESPPTGIETSENSSPQSVSETSTPVFRKCKMTIEQAKSLRYTGESLLDTIKRQYEPCSDQQPKRNKTLLADLKSFQLKRAPQPVPDHGPSFFATQVRARSITPSSMSSPEQSTSQQWLSKQNDFVSVVWVSSIFVVNEETEFIFDPLQYEITKDGTYFTSDQSGRAILQDDKVAGIIDYAGLTAKAKENQAKEAAAAASAAKTLKMQQPPGQTSSNKTRSKTVSGGLETSEKSSFGNWLRTIRPSRRQTDLPSHLDNAQSNVSLNSASSSSSHDESFTKTQALSPVPQESPKSVTPPPQSKSTKTDSVIETPPPTDSVPPKSIPVAADPKDDIPVDDKNPPSTIATTEDSNTPLSTAPQVPSSSSTTDFRDTNYTYIPTLNGEWFIPDIVTGDYATNSLLQKLAPQKPKKFRIFFKKS